MVVVTVTVGCGHSKTVRVGEPSTCRAVSAADEAEVLIEYVEELPWSVATERLTLESEEVVMRVVGGRVLIIDVVDVDDVEVVDGVVEVELGGVAVAVTVTVAVIVTVEYGQTGTLREGFPRLCLGSQ